MPARSLSVRVGYLPSNGPGFRGTPGYASAPGYPGSLTDGSGLTPLSGQTYSFLDFPGGLDVGSSGSPVTGVTFVGCRFHGQDPVGKLVGLWGDAAFDYCTFDPAIPPPVPYLNGYQYGIECDGGYGTHGVMTVKHSEAWGFGNVAYDINGNDHYFQDCWIHDASADGGIAHTDGIGSLSGAGACANVTIDHCTIESLGNTNGLAFQAGVYSNLTITNNLFGGFGYCICIWSESPSPATGIVFTDNAFSTRIDVGFGPLYPVGVPWWTDAAGSTWRRNKWVSTSGWGNPANNGKFWIPNGSNSPSDDSPFVSSSDYAGS